MSNYWGKQLSSRPVALTTTTTANATKVSAFTVQVRVVSSAAANFAIGDSSTTSTAWIFIPITGTVAEYFTVTPGQYYLPGAGMSVTEMS